MNLVRGKYVVMGLVVAAAFIFQIAFLFRAVAQPVAKPGAQSVARAAVVAQPVAKPGAQSVARAATQPVSAAVSPTGKPTVRARFVPDSVMIGDRFHLEVTVEKDVAQQVGFPVFASDTVASVLLILDDTPPDTIEQSGRRLRLLKKYEMTSFEDGMFDMGPYSILYLDKNITDTIWTTESLKLKVATFEIDTLTQSIVDIRPPLKTPVHPYEFMGYHGIWLVLRAILIALAVLWIFRWRKDKEIFLAGRRRSLEPPHVSAIRALEILHNQKLWQNGRHKIYYTRLADILREYLEGRYDIWAMEMTTEEILHALREAGMTARSYGELKDVLTTADLVKFAKFTPEGDYNEAAYNTAYYFVESTKPSEVEESPIVEEGGQE